MVQKERIEADVRREKILIEFQKELHVDFENRKLAEKETWLSESSKQAELERKLALEQQKTLLLQKQAEIEKLHSEKDNMLLEHRFRQVTGDSLSSDGAEATGSSDISLPRAKQAKISAGQAPSPRTTWASAVVASAPVDSTVRASVVPASAENNLRTPTCMPVVYDISSLLSARVDNSVLSLSTVCTPVYAQSVMTRPSPSVLPYVNMSVCQAPGQSANSVVNFVAQPSGPLLFTDSGSGSASVADTLGPSLVGPHVVNTQSGFNVNTVSLFVSLAPQPLFTQPGCTQPPPTTGLGLPQAQSSVSLGPHAPSSQSPVTAICGDTKATPYTIVASSSPETSTKSGDSVSVSKTVSSISASDSVAPTASRTVAAVPTVPQGV